MSAIAIAEAPFKVHPDVEFSEAQREELCDLLDVKADAYRDYPAFLQAVRTISGNAVPRFLREACERLRSTNVVDKPVYLLKNCPIDPIVPVLGYEDPLNEKYRLKKTFVGEAFLALFSELIGTCVVGYRTANNGDMFHDIHPMRALAHTPSQKTVDTIRFHADIPNNRVRPDWVYLLALRNSPANEVYTVFVRLRDVFERLDLCVRETLSRPLFYAPRETIHVYGGQPDGVTPCKPIVTHERGHTFLAYFEGNTRSDSAEGREAMQALDDLLHLLGDPVFLEERSLVAVSNNTAMHARSVVRIHDVGAHRNRWLLKTWNVDDISLHLRHLMPGRMHTSDE